MLEPQAAIADGFNANTQTNERKNTSVPPAILARLDDGQKAMMTWFLQGLSKAQMAQNVGVETAVMQQRFAEMRQKLRVADDCKLLSLVYGRADETKLDAAAERFGLTQGQKKVLAARLTGESVLDISARMGRDVDATMKAIHDKIGDGSLLALFAAVHNGHVSSALHTQSAANISTAAPEKKSQSQDAPSKENGDSVKLLPPEIAKLLTAREAQMAEFKLRGMSYKEIADTLDLSTATVADYVKAMYRKLEIHDENAFFNAVYGDIYPKELTALAKHYGMTKEEEGVIGRILSGLSVEKTAGDMKLTKQEVSAHINDVQQKMEIDSRNQIFSKAHEFIAPIRAEHQREKQGRLAQEREERENVAQQQIALLHGALTQG